MLSVSSPVADLTRLRAVVRTSRFAVALVGLRSGSFVEMSPAAASIAGAAGEAEGPADLAVMTAEPDAVRRTLVLVADGVLDACHIRTTMPDHGGNDSVLVALRAIARDADDAYAIALFSNPGPGPATRDQPTADAPASPATEVLTVEELLGPLLAPSRIDAELETFPGLENLTARQREILTRLLRGDRVSTISRGMHLAASTVRNHLTTLYRKLGVHSQAELIERIHTPPTRDASPERSDGATPGGASGR